MSFRVTFIILQKYNYQRKCSLKISILKYNHIFTTCLDFNNREFRVFKLGDNQISLDLNNALVSMGSHKGKLDKYTSQAMKCPIPFELQKDTKTFFFFFPMIIFHGFLILGGIWVTDVQYYHCMVTAIPFLKTTCFSFLLNANKC